MVKLLRLLRIARLFRYLAKFEEHFIQFNSSTLRMAKLSLLLLIFSHWNGCCQVRTRRQARAWRERLAFARWKRAARHLPPS